MGRLAAIFAFAGGLLVQAHGEPVYSNLSTPVYAWNWLTPDTPEVGDLLDLSGSVRTLHSVTYWLTTGTGHQGSADATYRVRSVDPNTGLPGAILSEATQRITYNTQDFQITMNMPAVELPESVFVTFQLANGTPGLHHYGAIAANPPTLGASDDEAFYVYDNLAQQWVILNGHELGRANLGIEVHAVPEPASLFILTGGVGLLFRTRRRLSRLR